MPGVKVLVTTGESRTGDYVVQNLLDPKSPVKPLIDEVTVLFPTSLTPHAVLSQLGAKVVGCDPENLSVNEIAALIKTHAPDTVVLIPPASHQKEQVADNFLNALHKVATGGKVVKNLVMVSSAGADESVEKSSIKRFAMMEKHAKEKFKDTDLNCCVIRTGSYMQNILLYVRQIHEYHFLGAPLPSDHSIAMLDARDAGAAVAIVSTSTEGDDKQMSKRHRNQHYVIAAESLTFRKMVDEINKQIPQIKDVMKEGYKEISRKEAEEYLNTVKDLDKSEIEVIQDMFELAREGKLATVTNDLVEIFKEQNLEPRTFQEFVKEYAKQFMDPNYNPKEE